MRSARRDPSRSSPSLSGTPSFSAITAEAAGMPLYRAVKRALLLSIESGAVAPSQTLPSESELAQGFGVSVGTVRRAVDDLVAEHILIRRQGRGTFVASHGHDRFLFQFFHVERSDGLREVPQVELVSFDRIRLDEDAAHALQVRTGEAAFQIENRLSLQGRPVVHDRLTITAAQFKGLTEKRWRERRSTVYHLYQHEFGITIAQAHERLRATGADRTAARVLGIAVGQPVLQVRRVALDLSSKPVEWRISTVVTSQHEYVNLLSRPV